MRLPFLFAVLVPFVAGCAPPPDDTAERANELTLRTLMSAFENADTALIAELFWPQASYDDFAGQTTHEGIEEIVGYVTSAHAWGDDVTMSVGSVHPSRTGAVGEWTFSAVQARPLGRTVPLATGLEVVTNGVTIIEIERGRIMRAADYVDTAPMWLQLGGTIDLPGGTVLRLQDPGNE